MIRENRMRTGYATTPDRPISMAESRFPLTDRSSPNA
jgi:hypothetical protein